MIEAVRDLRHFRGVSDGTRTRDRLDHNQELYQLSYAHHVVRASSLASSGPVYARRGQGPAFGEREALARRETRGLAPRQLRHARAAVALPSTGEPTPTRARSRAPRASGGASRPPSRPFATPLAAARALAGGLPALAGDGEHALGDVLPVRCGGAPAASHREALTSSSGPSRIVMSSPRSGLQLRSPSSHPVVRGSTGSTIARSSSLVEVEAKKLCGNWRISTWYTTAHRLAVAPRARLVRDAGAHDRARPRGWSRSARSGGRARRRPRRACRCRRRSPGTSRPGRVEACTMRRTIPSGFCVG